MAKELDDRWYFNVDTGQAERGQVGLQYVEGGFGIHVAEARRRGLDELGLLTNERYVDNIAMYGRYGYRETDRVPYRGTDLVYFRKRLQGAGCG